jgi:hypothetical protein
VVGNGRDFGDFYRMCWVSAVYEKVAKKCVINNFKYFYT